MSIESFFSGLEAEFTHILGIAVAAAPLVAVNDPRAAASIAAANAAVNYAKPLVDTLIATGNGQPTAEQIQAGLAVGLNLAQQSGKIDSNKAAQMSASIAAIAAISAAAAKPV